MIKRHSRRILSDSANRKYNWGFLKLNQDYVDSYNNLISEIESECIDSHPGWARSISDHGWHLPKTENADLINYQISEFSRKWRINQPQDPNLPLSKEVRFHTINDAVSFLTSAEDLQNNKAVSEIIGDMLKPILKNKKRKSEHLEAPRYALILVDLRWAQKEDLKRIADKIEDSFLDERDYPRDFSQISQVVIEKIISNADVLSEDSETSAALSRYSDIDFKLTGLRKPKSQFKTQVRAHRKYFNIFKRLAPLIPFRHVKD